jgi:hypothetical protein
MCERIEEKREILRVRIVRCRRILDEFKNVKL